MTILVLLLALIGLERRETLYFDLLEVNYVHDETGRVKICQIICWHWSPDYRRFDVYAWCLADRVADFPKRNGKLYECQLRNGKILRSQYYRETHSTIDPERKQSRLFPPSARPRYRATASLDESYSIGY